MNGNICMEKECSICCHGTEMELTPDDIRRIEDAGGEDFHVRSGESLLLRNEGGRCVFLDDGGRCSIYASRPAGCRLYPLVMDLSNWHAVLDSDCPHRNRFSIDPEDVLELERLVVKLTGGSS
ncbi:MAG: YkgJ family cysteine cluster protein [Thermoplasmatota archaeon]